MQLAYFLLIMCVMGSIECGLRQKRDDEPKETVPEKKEEVKPPTPESEPDKKQQVKPPKGTEPSTGGSGGKYPFIPENVQAWFEEFGSKFPGGPSKWFGQNEQTGGSQPQDYFGSIFSKAPWAKKEK